MADNEDVSQYMNLSLDMIQFEFRMRKGQQVVSVYRGSQYCGWVTNGDDTLGGLRELVLPARCFLLANQKQS